MDLSFMGSGFPCFYNFLRYCIMMLVTCMIVSGIFNIYTNSQGTFCENPDIM